jgi:PAS domain S-box-containing protein
VLRAFTDLFDKAPIGVVILDRDGVIIYVNQRQCEQSKLERADFLGKHHRSTAYATYERAGILPAYDRLLQEGTPLELTLPRYRRYVDGALISFTLRGFKHEGLTFLFTSVDQTLSAQLDRYEQLFENANDGIFILSREGKFVAVNRKWCEILGLPREQILGQTTEIVLPGRFAQSLARLERILREGQLGPYELELTTAVGPKVVSLNGFALYEGGQPVGVMNIARDVTQEYGRREEFEGLYRALRDSEEKFRRMIQGNPDPVALSDFKTGEFLEVNDAWCRFTGLDREHLLGREMRIVLFWPDRDERKRFADALRRDGFARDFDASLILRGEHRLGSISGALLELDGRQTVVTWLRDVTESQRMEIALRESEERFRQLAAAAPVGIFRTDTSGRCTYTNSRWQQMAGLTLEQSLGYGWSSVVHPQDVERVVREWQATVAQGGDYEGEFRFRTPQGTERWTEVHGRPIRSERGEVLGFVGTTEDVSERKAAEQMRGDVVRMLSHDIKTPLAVIRGFVDIIREDLAAGRYADTPSALDAIESAVDQAMGLATNFLDAERMESGQLRPRRDPGSMNDIVEEVLRHQTASARVRKVVLKSELEESLPIDYFDRGLIERVLANLVSNALKFSPQGGTVVVATRSTEQTIALSVSDGGPGVDGEALPNLFQRFSTGGRPSPNSTGLGLFIVKTIVEAHGGTVAVERNPQGGACFTVTLPRSLQDHAPEPPRASDG